MNNMMIEYRIDGYWLSIDIDSIDSIIECTTDSIIALGNKTFKMKGEDK